MADETAADRGIRTVKRALRSRWAGAGVLVLGGVLLGWALYPGADYAMHVWIEALGIAVLIGAYVLVNRWQIERQYYNRLIDDVGGISGEAARSAVHQMRRHGLLHGDAGLLRGANLERATLAEANLREANLRGAVLIEANLREADLRGAGLDSANLIKAALQGADLTDADLRGALLQNADAQAAVFFRADLGGANFFGARLTNANLREANLRDANLTDADLHGANMSGANLERARLKAECFDTETWLPDGRYWTSGTDLTRYTDPAHPDFWRSADQKSPAWADGTGTWRRRRRKKEDA